MSRRRITACAVAAVLAVACVAGCTVPRESSARRLPASDVPFGLAVTTTTSTSTITTTATNDGGATTPDTVPVVVDQDVKVFLVRDERLAVVHRLSGPAEPSNVLALLAQGPTEDETRAGLRTALVPDLAKIVEVNADLITIDLDAEFSALAPTEQRLALAQITYAMTQLAAINHVRFLVGGQAASVPRGDGSSTDQPVSPADYADFAPS